MTDSVVGAGWRPMIAPDIPAVMAIAAAVHPAYPEREEVFRERLSLAPGGCWIAQNDGAPLGYIVSHPARFGAPPALDTLLGALPDHPDTFYIHDLALLPQARGRRLAAPMLAHLTAKVRAAGFATLSLVAVNGSSPFWSRHGFVSSNHLCSVEKLSSYGSDSVFMSHRLC